MWESTKGGCLYPVLVAFLCQEREKVGELAKIAAGQRVYESVLVCENLLGLDLYILQRCQNCGCA